jgi:hypothetical protein
VALAFDVDRGRLDLVAAGADGVVRHWRREGDAWQPLAVIAARALGPPALAADPAGTLHLALTGGDGRVMHARHVEGRWEPPAPLGVTSGHAPALAYNFLARVLELVVVAPDGRLLHNRLRDGAWGTWQPAGNQASETPALGTSFSSAALHLIAAAPDGALYHQQLPAGGGWQPPARLPAMGEAVALDQPALAVGPTGSLEVAVTAASGAVRTTRRTAGRWQGWQTLDDRAAATPALLYNSDADALELAATAPDGTVRHWRQVNGVWARGGELGGAAMGTPALVQGAGGDLELAVAAADRVLYRNRFLPRAPGLVSFTDTIEPLFNAHCTGCHEGPRPPMGLDLAATRSYEIRVNTPAREARRLPRVAPREPERSYLYLKLTGAHAAAGGSGTPMPPDFPLADDEIARVRDWIAQGALRN